MDSYVLLLLPAVYMVWCSNVGFTPFHSDRFGCFCEDILHYYIVVVKPQQLLLDHHPPNLEPYVEDTEAAMVTLYMCSQCMKRK
jgi:hypothetical protein